MRGKRKPPTPVSRLRKIGIVERNLNPAQRAGLYWRGAHHWMPKVILWIKLCCFVALLGALACLVIVFTRPRPILLVSFPDGTTACALPPLDPKTGKIIPRPHSESELCRMLAKRSGRADDEQNAEFAKFSQAEPPSVEKVSLGESIKAAKVSSSMATPLNSAPPSAPTGVDQVISPPPPPPEPAIAPPPSSGGV